MRSILIDWLIDVQLRFKLKSETLFLTVNIIDRYLSKLNIHKTKLQLLGTTAMYIASKYEEIYPPKVKDFAYVTDNTYSRSEILIMEQDILNILSFNISLPSSYHFLQQFWHTSGIINSKVLFMGKYLLELCLLDFKTMHYRPSLIAASALYTSNRLITKDKQWNNEMASKTGYKDSDLKKIVRQLLILIQSADKSSLTAVKRKYSCEKYGEVSKVAFKKKQHIN